MHGPLRRTHTSKAGAVHPREGRQSRAFDILGALPKATSEIAAAALPAPLGHPPQMLSCQIEVPTLNVDYSVVAPTMLAGIWGGTEPARFAALLSCYIASQRDCHPLRYVACPLHCVPAPLRPRSGGDTRGDTRGAAQGELASAGSRNDRASPQHRCPPADGPDGFSMGERHLYKWHASRRMIAHGVCSDLSGRGFK
jgi:hypothetical protein